VDPGRERHDVNNAAFAGDRLELVVAEVARRIDQGLDRRMRRDDRRPAAREGLKHPGGGELRDVDDDAEAIELVDRALAQRREPAALRRIVTESHARARPRARISRTR
jgi:hypothetical protein